MRFLRGVKRFTHLVPTPEHHSFHSFYDLEELIVRLPSIVVGLSEWSSIVYMKKCDKNIRDFEVIGQNLTLKFQIKSKFPEDSGKT